MGKHPIRCGYMCPLRIALTLGQVAHATPGVKSGGEGVCGHSGQNGQKSPKSGHSKNRISVSQEKGASGFCIDANRNFASLLQQEKFIVFSALCFASPAACCWCRDSCCLFLEMKSFCFDEIQSLQVSPG